MSEILQQKTKPKIEPRSPMMR